MEIDIDNDITDDIKREAHDEIQEEDYQKKMKNWCEENGVDPSKDVDRMFKPIVIAFASTFAIVAVVSLWFGGYL